MQTRICLTCRFQASKDVGNERRPCAACIARSGFSKWEQVVLPEPITEDKKEEDNHA